MIKRAVVYLRVSTNKQLDGASLETQELMCQSWATNNGVVVDQIFHDDGVSAKTLNRPAMQELLAYLTKNKGRISYLITYQTDRLTRNASDFYALKLALSGLGVAYKNINSTLEANLNDEFIQGIEAVLAQHENRIKSERVTENMQRHAKDGYRMSKAPYGLRNVRDLMGRSTVEPTPDVADKIAILLEAYATGSHTMSSLLAVAKEMSMTTMGGKEIKFQILSKMLRQPLYAGLEVNKHTKGLLVKSKFKGIITPATFHRNQDLLRKNKNTAATYTQVNPLFPLRRFLTCEKCNKAIRASSPTNGSGVSSPRYHCTTKGCQSIKPDDLHKQFTDLLADYSPTPAAQKMIKELIVKVWKRELQTINSKEKALHRALERLREHKQQAIAKVVAGELTGDEKDQYLLGHDQEVKDIQVKLNEVGTITSLKEETIDYALEFMANTPQIWNNASIEHKIIYQQLLFPQGLAYDLNANTFGTVKINPLYRLANTTKDPSMTDESLMVIPWRIELQLPG